MSDTTIAKLAMAQRDRELHAEHRWSVADLAVLPLAAILFLILISWATVARLVACVARFRLPAEETAARDTLNRDRPGG